MKTTRLVLSTIGFLLLTGVSGQAQSATAKPAAAPAGMPSGAEKVTDGVWKWKDPQGKRWIYRQGPFGFSREPEEAAKPAEPLAAAKPAETAGKAAPSSLRVVKVKGGEVTFEKPTPFGTARRTRPLAELNADEKAAYDAYQKPAPTAAAHQPDPVK